MRPPRAKQMIDTRKFYEGSVLSCIRTDKKEDTLRYAYVAGDKVGDGVIQIDKLIEKPGPKDATSNLAAVSGYLLTPSIFPILEKLKPGKSGELWLPDAIKELVKKEPVYACEIKNGKYFDTGNKPEYLKTVVEFSLKHPEISNDFRTYLKSLKL